MDDMYCLMINASGQQSCPSITACDKPLLCAASTLSTSSAQQQIAPSESTRQAEAGPDVAPPIAGATACCGSKGADGECCQAEPTDAQNSTVLKVVH
jgi:hypothetical protein